MAIIGGCLSATKKRTNKVSTFDKTIQTWTSYYLDLLSVRSKPGVVTHQEHVIVARGGLDDTTLAQDNIEVLNWVKKTLIGGRCPLIFLSQCTDLLPLLLMITMS